MDHTDRIKGRASKNLYKAYKLASGIGQLTYQHFRHPSSILKTAQLPYVYYNKPGYQHHFLRGHATRPKTQALKRIRYGQQKESSKTKSKAKHLRGRTHYKQRSRIPYKASSRRGFEYWLQNRKRNN